MSATNLPRLLSLPQIAQATGASIDAMRRNTAALAAEGVIERAGSTWVCERDRAHLVPAALAKLRAERRAK